MFLYHCDTFDGSAANELTVSSGAAIVRSDTTSTRMAAIIAHTMYSHWPMRARYYDGSAAPLGDPVAVHLRRLGEGVARARQPICIASYTLTEPPLLSPGQPLAITTASCRLAASTIVYPFAGSGPLPSLGDPSDATVAAAPNGAPISTTAARRPPNHAIQRSI